MCYIFWWFQLKYHRVTSFGHPSNQERRLRKAVLALIQRATCRCQLGKHHWIADMAKLQIHPVGLGVIIFGFLVWIIALGGSGAATYQCQKTNEYAFCAKEYQWEWWSLWLEFALLLALFVTCFLESAFKRGQAVFLAYFTIATMCVMLSSHNFITQLQLGPINVRDLGQDSVNAAAAGFVLLGLTNFVILIVLGKDFGVQPQNQYQQPGMQFQTSAPV